MLESMGVIGIDIHVVVQLKEVILTVLYGLESMGVIGIQIHVGLQLEEVIWHV